MLPLYAQRLGATPVLVGFIMAAPSLFQLLLCIPGGIVAGQLGKRWVFGVSLMLGAAAALVYFFAPNALWLFVAQFLFGTSHGLFWPSQGAYLADLARPEERSSLLGFSFGLTSVSFLVGPPIAGLLMDSLQPNILFLVYLAALMGGLVLTWRLPATISPEARKTLGLALLARESFDAVRQLLTVPAIQLAVAGTWLMFVCWGVFDSFFPLHLQSLGFSASVLGVLLMVRGIVVGALRFSGGWFAARLKVRRFMVVGLAASGLALILIAFAGSLPFLVLVAVLSGTGPGFVPVAAATLIASALDEKRRPVGMAINEVGVGLGRLTGSTTFGYVADTAGLGASFVSAGALVIMGSLLLLSRVGSAVGKDSTARM